METCTKELWTDKAQLSQDTLSTERIVWFSLALCAIIEGTTGFLDQDIDGVSGAIIALAIVLLAILAFRLWNDNRTDKFPRKCDLSNLWYRHWTLIPPAMILVFIHLILAFVESTSPTADGLEVAGGLIMFFGVIAAWLTRAYCCIPDGPSQGPYPEDTPAYTYQELDDFSA